MPENRPTCAACGETIGVYEPVVVVAPQGTAPPIPGQDDAADAPLLRYHMACWTASSRCGERAA